tara:strand:- start:61 stop:318 length:258 start_codon:yes stop_codon:yes gene_type:complete
MSHIVYKIRDKRTGLFSSGGYYPYWDKYGKIWKQEAHVKSHLTMYTNCFYGRKVLEIENWEIVPYSLEALEVYSANVLHVRPAKK